jgi:hypothetical protein
MLNLKFKAFFHDCKFAKGNVKPTQGNISAEKQEIGAILGHNGLPK